MITVKGFQFKDDEHCIGLSKKNLKKDGISVIELILHKNKYEYNKIRTVVLDYVYEDHDKGKHDITFLENVSKVVNCIVFIALRTLFSDCLTIKSICCSDNFIIS